MVYLGVRIKTKFEDTVHVLAVHSDMLRQSTIQKIVFWHLYKRIAINNPNDAIKFASVILSAKKPLNYGILTNVENGTVFHVYPDEIPTFDMIPNKFVTRQEYFNIMKWANQYVFYDCLFIGR